MITGLVLNGAEICDVRQLEDRSYGRGIGDGHGNGEGGGNGSGRCYDKGYGKCYSDSNGSGYGNGFGEGGGCVIGEYELHRQRLQWSAS